jgi:hypothetical protein
VSISTGTTTCTKAPSKHSTTEDKQHSIFPCHSPCTDK